MFTKLPKITKKKKLTVIKKKFAKIFLNKFLLIYNKLQKIFQFFFDKTRKVFHIFNKMRKVFHFFPTNAKSVSLFSTKCEKGFSFFDKMRKVFQFF